jgi:hypothetical protein
MASCPDESGGTDMRAYVPSQTERADQLHQLTCPCAGGQPAAPTSYSVRDRKIRSLATGCCPWWTVTSISVSGGSGYTVGSTLSLNGGEPVDKPLLVRVTTVNGGGAITGVEINYAGRYYQKSSAPYTLTLLTGSGSSASVSSVTWSANQVCPCPWQYKKTA